MMRRTHAGFTLIELTMAASIMLVIGLAVTTLTVALSNVNANSEAYYEYAQSCRVGTARLQALLRRSRLVTAASASQLVLWASDDRDPGQINVSEVVKVYFRADTGELIERSTIFPSTLSEETRAALDAVVPLADLTDPAGAENPTGPSQYDVERVLARSVRGFRLYAASPAPLIRLLKFDLTAGPAGKLVMGCGGGMLRADKVGLVGESGGQYVLISSGT